MKLILSTITLILFCITVSAQTNSRLNRVVPNTAPIQEPKTELVDQKTVKPVIEGSTQSPVPTSAPISKDDAVRLQREAILKRRKEANQQPTQITPLQETK